MNIPDHSESDQQTDILRQDRVIRMEKIYDRISAVLQSGENADMQLKELQEDIRILQNYYETGWLEDYDAEQRGAFPKDLKRGILSEDALYDLFCEIDEREKKG